MFNRGKELWKRKPMGPPDSSYKYAFTVFTPTYNRAHTLHRVYESLKAQTFEDFEWLIVDDGSTDETNRLVEQWQKDAWFPIRYVYQENKGKHAAFNHGVRIANGELFLTLDSDDACTPESLERFKYHWDSIPPDRREGFSAVTGLCKDQNGRLIGNRFPFDPTDSDSIEIKYRFEVTGDKCGFHRTDVLKQFPFPEGAEITFVPEGVVWNRVAKRYKTRYVNEVLRTVWTDEPASYTKVLKANPSWMSVGARIEHLTALNEAMCWFWCAPEQFVRSAVAYSCYSFHVGSNVIDQFKDLDHTLSRMLWAVTLPLGFLWYLRHMVLMKAGRITTTSRS